MPKQVGDARGRRVVGVETPDHRPVLTFRDGWVRPYSPNLVKAVYSTSRFEDHEWTILGSARGTRPWDVCCVRHYDAVNEYVASWIGEVQR